MQTKHLHPVFLSLYDVEWQLSADSVHSQFSGNGGALSQSTLEGHSTAVKTDNVFDNGEAQSSSAHTSAAALIHPHAGRWPRCPPRRGPDREPPS